METNGIETSVRYQGIELGEHVYIANHMQSRVERAIVSGVSLKLCADGIARAEYYTLINKADGEHRNAIYPTEIFKSELAAYDRLIQMLNNEIKDSQEEIEAVREAKVRARIRMEELQRQQCMGGENR